jgi:hypothetical protein
MQLEAAIISRLSTEGNDQWKFSWGGSTYSTSKAYKILKGGRSAHPVYHNIWRSKCQMKHKVFFWLLLRDNIWRSKCQMKHKVFFWLLLRDRLSTRDLLRRKYMELDSYTCDQCILQRPETGAHLFLRCNFAKSCWNSLGVTYVSTRTVLQIFVRIREKLAFPFFMEIIILMAWSIWLTRNDWIFHNKDPLVEDCRRTFKKEFSLLLLRAKPTLLPTMMDWLDTI